VKQLLNSTTSSWGTLTLLIIRKFNIIF
jgi:hypothetical protein